MKTFYPTVLLSILLSAGQASAVMYTWTGAADADWTNPANWDANGVPVDFDPNRSGLSFESSDSDRIVIDATDFSPTTNVPVLNPNNSIGAVTPTVDVLNGSVAFSLNSSLTGQTIIDSNTFTTIGDGDASNGLASLTYNNPGVFRRGGNFAMKITVNSDGSLIFGANTTVSYDGNKTLHVTLAGGTVIFNGTVDLLRNSTAAGNSWFDFTAPGATFTASFGVDFADLGTVDTYIGSGLTFRSTTNLDLEAMDNGNGTFTVAVIAPATTFPLTIRPNAATVGNYDLEWASQPGKLYDLLTSTDLAEPVADWPVYDDGETLYEGIPGDGETTTLTAVPSTDPSRFFALREYDAPPLVSADFEDDNGGFTTSTDAGTAWEWGEPDSVGFGGTVTAGNDGSAKCWGTGIGNPGFYANPTTNSRLISPIIDLTSVAAAELSFAHAIDLDTNDSAVVRVFDADTDEEIVVGVFPLTISDDDLSAALWETSGPFALPVGAPIRIEWILSGTGGDNEDFMGWYIDDVVVTETTP